MGKQQKGSLVSTWLQTIGLDHVVPIFNAAGIVTPTDLAELDVTHYEALGVSQASDRKKLFYLVQRIKMAVDIVEDHNDEEDDDEDDRYHHQGGHRYEFHVDDELQQELHYEPPKRTTRKASVSSRSSLSSSRNRHDRNALEESAYSSKYTTRTYRDYPNNEQQEEDNYTDEFDQDSEESEEEQISYNQQSHVSSRGRTNHRSHHRYATESDEYSSADDVPSPPPAEARRTKKTQPKNLIRYGNNDTSELSGVRRSARLANHPQQQQQQQQLHVDTLLPKTPTRMGARYDISPSGEVETHLHHEYQDVSDYEEEEDINNISVSSTSYSRNRIHRPRKDHDDERSVQSSRSNHHRNDRKSVNALRHPRKMTQEYTSYEQPSNLNSDNEDEQYYRSRKSIGRKQTVRTSNLSRHRLPDDDDENNYDATFQYNDELNNSYSNIRYINNQTFDNESKRSTHITSDDDDDDDEVSETNQRALNSSSINNNLDTSKRLSSAIRQPTCGVSRSSSVSSSVSSRRTSSGLTRSQKSLQRSEDTITTEFDSQSERFDEDKSISSKSKSPGRGRRKAPNNNSQTTSSQNTVPLRRSNLQKPSVQVRSNPNKRLSTIPSERPAPMSPLMTMSSQVLDQDYEPGTRKANLNASTMDHDSDNASVQSNSSRGSKSSQRSRTKKTTNLRSKDLDDNESVKSDSRRMGSNTNDENRLNGSNYTNKPNNSILERSQNLPTSPGGSKKSPVRTRSPTRRIVSRSRSNRSVTRSRSPGRSNDQERFRNLNSSFECANQSVINPANETSKLNASISSISGPVFVHGIAEDNSWSAQVSRLREDNELAYGGPYNASSGEYDNMRIRVVIRKRPMSKKEMKKTDDVDVIHPLQYDGYGKIHVYQPKTRVDLTKEIETINFAYDNVFSEGANNVQIYESAIRNLIPGVFERQWASVFAYGQTGSGKTFTMMGSSLTGMKAGNKSSNLQNDSNLGLYYLAAQDLFYMARHDKYKHLSIGVSLFEIYGGKLFDLLNSRNAVKCLEDSRGQVCFPGLSEHPISNADELMGIIEAGALNRSTGTTSANADSSRSHAVLQLSLRKQVGRKSNVEHGRLTFIDLAGSERGADTSKASRTTRLEGAEINTSLLALKEVIRALATGGSMTHIPFRGSKLTQVLKESFVGKNSRTVMVACVAPNMTNCEHTLNTLRYADRVKERDSETGKLTAAVANASRIQTKNVLPFTTSRPITAPPGENDLDRTSSRASLIGNTNSVENNSKHSAPVSTNDTESLESDYDVYPEEDIDDSHYENEDYGRNNETVSEDEFENIFRSPDKKALEGKLQDSPFKSSKRTDYLDMHNQNRNDGSSKVYLSKKEAVQPLVATHRSIMTEMLGMVKHEMSLVNCTDADRDTIDEYLQELEQTQEKQLSLIGTLRNALVDYYASRPPNEESSTRAHGFHSETNTSNLLSDDDFEDLRD